MGTLVWNSRGRPMAQCPVCGRVHSVLRRGDYLAKPTVRFHCRNPECRTTWVASAEEKQQLVAHFEVHQAKKSTSRAPKQKPPERKPTGASTQQEPSTETRKSSFWDHFV